MERFADVQIQRQVERDGMAHIFNRFSYSAGTKLLSFE